MGQFKYITMRLLQFVPTFLVVMAVVFVLIRALPGDPASAMLGDRASDQSVARLYQEMGLGEPIVVQFGIFVQRFFSGDIGESIVLRQPVFDLIVERMRVTIFLTAYSALLSVLIAFPAAVIAALNRDRAADHVIRIVAQIGLSSPVFFVGLVILTFLAAKLRLFPVGGYGDGFVQNIYYLFLPALSLALYQSAILVRNLRSSVIDILKADFVEFAEANGLSRKVVLLRYVLRNAMIPTITLVGINIGYLIGGAAITETVFGIPGAGRLMIDSIFGRDYPVIQGLTLSFALLVSLVFLLTDLVVAWLDPRAREFRS